MPVLWQVILADLGQWRPSNNVFTGLDYAKMSNHGVGGARGVKRIWLDPRGEVGLQ